MVLSSEVSEKKLKQHSCDLEITANGHVMALRMGYFKSTTAPTLPFSCLTRTQLQTA